MNFSELYFGKLLHDLEIKDLVDFFATAREETNRIEFKSFAEQSNVKNDLKIVKKGICALLNSEGGILIWGAPLGRVVSGKKEKVFQGNLSPVTNQYEKDQLINMIADSLTPMPVSIKVQPIKSDNKFVYVFEVQPSTYRPLQFENRYYIRMDGQTRPAPHYLIEALMKEVRYPNIEGYLKIRSIHGKDTSKANSYVQGYLIKENERVLATEFAIYNFSPLQNEESVSLQMSLNQGKFTNSTNPGSARKLSKYGEHMYSSQVTGILHYGQSAIHRENIVIPLESTTENILTIVFGGRYSPAKRSWYVLSLNNIKPDTTEDRYGNTDLSHNSIIIGKEENVLMAELEERQQLIQRNQLKRYLGR